ncbi:hypothetical protein SAMN05421823_11920 [Catalinimonas alkaloidigena]|uniref:Uncharacterized protein n=1 Tax=Catalinimonas alkaloidigena TaxID=1075417 RepID=A0A1G9V578_9BACT|nr:hypothetical protein [Catalinimonas alkaloidigena]SDM67318.1 hypothetical protein SAMN05421823_11920 [Catalinimonas alkaloidigena]
MNDGVTTMGLWAMLLLEGIMVFEVAGCDGFVEATRQYLDGRISRMNYVNQLRELLAHERAREEASGMAQTPVDPQKDV